MSPCALTILFPATLSLPWRATGEATGGVNVVVLSVVPVCVDAAMVVVTAAVVVTVG